MERAAIEALIPHEGSMCLLDEVISFDSENIVCSTRSHRRADNPFMVEGELPTLVLVEYGAQAAAVHAGLLQTGIASGGTAFLGAIKSMKINAAMVAPSIEQLRVEASCLLNDSSGAIYRFQCGSDSDVLISGRLVLVL